MKCGHLLMAHLDELNPAIGPVQRSKHAIDAIAGVPEDFPDSPRVEPLYEEVADGLCHGQSSRWLPSEAGGAWMGKTKI